MVERLISQNHSCISSKSKRSGAIDGGKFEVAKRAVPGSPGSTMLFALVATNVAGKRSNNKLKSWPNIRCRVGTEVWNDYEKNSEAEECRRGREGGEKKSCIACLSRHLRVERKKKSLQSWKSVS